MLKYIDRELRKVLKPVIPTTVILNNLHYDPIQDLTDLDSPRVYAHENLSESGIL